MPKPYKPNSDTEVLEVMQKYCIDKGYNFSDTQLDYMAQSCYLYFESKGWKGVTYWPAVCMRWVLNNLRRSYETREPGKQHRVKHNYKPKGKSVRDIIMGQENGE